MFRIKKTSSFGKQKIDYFDIHPNYVHKIPFNELYLHLKLSDVRDGLTVTQINEAQSKYGLNRLQTEKQPNRIRLFLKETIKGFNVFLWVAAILAFLVDRLLENTNSDRTNLVLGMILVSIIILNGSLGVYQKIKSKNLMHILSITTSKLVTVRRNNGQEEYIPTDQLVPGDVVILRTGDIVPADCRIVSCENLRVNNAQLSGESKPVYCTTFATSDSFLSSKNIIHYSSSVIDGHGTAVVVATGEQTVLGRVNKLVHASNDNTLTSLHRQVNRFLLFIIAIVIIFFIIVSIIRNSWLKTKFPDYASTHVNMFNAINIIVGFLPVGLPSVVTIVFIIISRKMLSQHVLVRSSQTLEKMNSISILCTDKTGTLTENQMRCTHLLWDVDQECQISNACQNQSHDPGRKSILKNLVQRFSNFSMTNLVSPINTLNEEDIPKIQRLSIDQVYFKGWPQKDLVLGACLCNDAKKYSLNKHQNLEFQGDADDIALYDLCESRFNLDVESVRQLYPRVHSSSFNSKNKLMIVANRVSWENQFPPILNNRSNQILLTMKGATDVLLDIDKCSSYKTKHGEIKPLTSQIRAQLFRRQERMGLNGYRVIAMLQKMIDESSLDHILLTARSDDPYNGLPIDDYTFIGLFCLIDPPRKCVTDTVNRIREARIRIAMITGDHPTTAISIAKQVQIFSSAISERKGFDSFHLIGIDTPTGRPVMQLLRNGQPLDTHVLNAVNYFKEFPNRTSRIQIINDDDESRMSLFKRFSTVARYYFSLSKEEVEFKEKSSMIPYAIIMKGSDITYMDEFMWDWVLAHEELIFARTTPEQKLRIVMEFQRRGEVVAVTGDGTNDAPALKRSDLGVTIQAASDLSKDACDLMLMDNNFSSIVGALENGRLLHDNLKKVSIYLLSGGSCAQIWPVFLNICLGIPLALSAFQATVFCMLNDTFMALAIATEKAEENLMHRPPTTKSQSHLLNSKLLFHGYMVIGSIECLSAFFCFFLWHHDNGIPLSKMLFQHDNPNDQFTQTKQRELSRINETGQCIYYVSLCIVQVFNLLTTRSRYGSFFTHNPRCSFLSRNLWSIVAIIASTLICICVTEIPLFQNYFKTHSVPLFYILPAFGFGFLLFFLDELRKLYIRRNPISFLGRIAW